MRETYALRVGSAASTECSPGVPSPCTCTSVHDRPLRRLLAWLLDADPRKDRMVKSAVWADSF